MSILLNNDGHWHEKYLAAASKYLPGHVVEEFGKVSNPEEIEYALIWKHPDGDLLNYPNLKAVFSLGSGTDYLDAHGSLPKAPIFRLIDPNMANDMALYTLYWIIHFQRGMEKMREQQARSQWRRYPTPLAQELQVCVLGQGAIGGHIARTLSKNGYCTFGWSRSDKTIEGVHSVSGMEALAKILPEIDVLVCMLPSNHSTQKFLNSDVFSKLKKGSVLINISRGAVVDEEHLLNALDQGPLASAVLDVFALEPLPESSVFWSHPNVHVTPHMSGATNPETSVKIIAENIEKIENAIMPDYRYIREE